MSQLRNGIYFPNPQLDLRLEFTVKSGKRRQQLEQSVYCETDSARRSPGSDDQQRQDARGSDKLKGPTQDLFELLERVQSSRLDDQRCVLPPYFNQVSFFLSSKPISGFNRYDIRRFKWVS
ncbi:hypothetical protein TKK_0002028 [Trichogramma kaykai]